MGVLVVVKDQTGMKAPGIPCVESHRLLSGIASGLQPFGSQYGLEVRGSSYHS